jgi:predicted ATPase
LSVQLGRTLLDRFPDGVWLVELAPLTDPERLPQAVAAVLGLREQPGQAAADALRRFVADRQLLLILDNCEHLLDAAAALAKSLLQAGPALQVLATSREVLRVAGELAYPVPALALPAPQRAGEGAPAIDELLRHEAVRMFVDRATSAQPAFVIDADNAAALVEICHRLDGIPLALELAAARVRMLPLPAIAERLRSSFALLSTRDATVAPRQRTLQLLIDWSHQLLGADERVLFRRLSVFAGGWTLPAAEAVCADETLLPADTVLETLSQLVEKSLVVSLPAAGDDGPRYRLLDTVRQYAAQQLEAASERAVHDRQLLFCLQLAETARPFLGGPEQAGWLARLDAERDNLLAAQAHAAAHVDDAGPALRLAGALRDYWINRGLLTLGLAGAHAALDHPRAQVPDMARAQGLFHAAQLCLLLGRYAQAGEHLEQSLAIARAAGESARVASLLQPLGTVYAALGDAVRARACFEDAVAAERQLGRPRQLAAALVALALWFGQQQQADAAEPLYREALAIARAQGDDDAVATTLLNLAMLDVGRGQRPAAVSRLLEALALIEQAGSQPLLLALYDLGFSLAVAAEDWPHALLWQQAADAVCQRTALHREAADAAFLAPWSARLQAAQQAGIAPPAAGAGPDASLGALTAWLRSSASTSR